MHNAAVYGKTEIGLGVLHSTRGTLSAAARRLLILTDGHRDLDELCAMLGSETVLRWLPSLANAGFVRPVRDPAPQPVPAAAVAAPAAVVAPAAPVPAGPARGRTLALLARVTLLAAIVGAIWWWYAHAAVDTAPAGAGAGEALAEIPAPAVPPAAPPVVLQQSTPEPAPAGALPPRRAANPEHVRLRAGDGAVSAAPLAARLQAPTPLTEGSAGAVAPAAAAATGSAAPDLPARAAPVTLEAAPLAAADSLPHESPAAPGESTIMATALLAGSAPVPGPVPPASSLVGLAPAPAPGSAPPALHARNQELPHLSRRARRAGINRGELLVRLQVNAQGAVDRVDLVRADPPQVYDTEVERTLLAWTFDAPGQPMQKTFVLNFQP